MNKEDYSKYYIQGSDHYLIPKDVFDELFNEMVNWKEESKELNQKYLNAVADYETTMSELQELKNQLEEYKRLGFKHLNDKCNKLENQQKEFINYLENEKDRLARECSHTYEDSLGKTRFVNEDIFNEVDKNLSKYKEIIGGKNGNLLLRSKEKTKFIQ